MLKSKCNLLLADDDPDDCTFFKEALEDLPVSFSLTTVNNGEELMSFLTANEAIIPDALFLDLNMPRKGGFECLLEIKINHKLKDLPVFIFSTSLDIQIVNLLYDNGAAYYIRKPAEFSELKKVLFTALTLLEQDNVKPIGKSSFIIHPS